MPSKKNITKHESYEENNNDELDEELDDELDAELDEDKYKDEDIDKKTTESVPQNVINDPNHVFKVAETFVGCGGSHFGFKKSGFKSVFVNDIWEDAINTLKQNDSDLKPNEVICDDIYNINLETLNEKNIDISNIDVFIGGVVCKGFSLAGVRNPYDERNYLYLQQLRLVGILKPKISIIENVPGMLNMKILSKNNDENVKILCDELNNICESQKKLRGKLIAENKKLLIDETSIETKNKLNDMAKLRKEKEKLLEKYKYSVVEDIEKIYNELGYNVYKKILTCSDYGCYTNRQRLFIVAVRKDLNIVWKYPEPTTKASRPTVKMAFDLLDYNTINNPNTDVDNRPMNHTDKSIEKFKKIQPGGKSEEGYFSRGTSSRLTFDKPAPTLVPGHSAFQIHPTQHRSITVREGATISGFNTDFKFCGSHSSRCMQIGNAIPVNMAYAIAEQCKKILTGQL